MVARWRQLFSQGQVTSRSSGSQSTSLNHSGAMQASMTSFYCSGLICHNINSFLSGMSAYYHMDLETFALAPKKGIEEDSPRILPFANSSSSQATWLRELIETWVGTKCSGTPVFQWRPWTMSPPFKQRLLIHTHYGDFFAFWLEIVTQSLSWFFEDWGDGGHVRLGDGRGEVGRVHGASEGSALLGV